MNLGLSLGLSRPVVEQDSGEVTYAIPTLIWLGGDSSGSELTTADTLAGDFAIGFDTNGNTTPIAAGPTGTTAIGTGGVSDLGTDVALLASCKFLLGANETIAANGSSRRVWGVFRGVDPDIITLLEAGVTYAYGNTTGQGTWDVPALTLPRPCVVLTGGRRGGAADTNFGTTLLRRQNTASSPAQLYWTGANNTLGTEGTEVESFAGETPVLISTVGRSAFSLALLGAEE